MFFMCSLVQKLTYYENIQDLSTVQAGASHLKLKAYIRIIGFRVHDRFTDLRSLIHQQEIANYILLLCLYK